MQHIIVDTLPGDPWSRAAAIAALVAAAAGIAALIIAAIAFNQARRQTSLAEDSFRIAKEELDLANQQLVETQKATEQTQKALSLSRKQLQQLRKAEIDRARSLAPRVTARMKAIEKGPAGEAWGTFYALELSNGGALGLHLMVSGYDGSKIGKRVDLQKLQDGESIILYDFSAANDTTYLQNIRIRVWDVLGNKYITEYRHLSATLAWPVFRNPWLAPDIEPQPEHTSDTVSWDVEHFERVPGIDPEKVEEGFNIDEPV